MALAWKSPRSLLLRLRHWLLWPRPASGRPLPGAFRAPLALAVFLLAVCQAAFPNRAAANGAFPDSMQIFVPADRPHEIILATNFGLIISEDDGTTWYWTCEPNPDANAFLYQMGPAPSDRLFAVLVANGLVYSDDLACSWSTSGGALATAITSDAFPDPTSASRVFAVATERGEGSASALASIYRSDDGGLTFGPALYTSPTGGGILGVESAFSDPATVYVSAYGTAATGGGALDPILVASSDGGEHWAGADLAGSLGFNDFRIIAGDRADPRRLFLRVLRINDSTPEKLAVSMDGGLTFQQPISVDDKLTSFVRLASGTVLVGANTVAGPVGFRSSDGGATFQAWPNPPHLRAMAERGGELFVAAQNFIDPYAVGVSTDEGLTFKGLLSYDQVKGIKPCVQTVCRDACDLLAGLTLWSPEVCAGTPSPKGGCGCRAGQDGEGDRGGVVATLLGAAAMLFLAGRRGRGVRPRPPAG